MPFLFLPVNLLSKIAIFLFCLTVFYTGKTDAVIIANSVEIHISIEDAEREKGIITNAVFENESIDLSKKNFMHRKVTKIVNVAPGQYEIAWTTEKSKKPWGDDKEIKTHRRVIIIELTDAVVYINIRGEALTTY